MPTLTIHYDTEAERVALERAVSFVSEMHRLGLDAPDGRLIDDCEALALGRGRDLLRQTLASAVQTRADRIDQKGAAKPAPSATRPPETRGGGGGRC